MITITNPLKQWGFLLDIETVRCFLELNDGRFDVAFGRLNTKREGTWPSLSQENIAFP